MRILAILILSFPSIALAECYVVGDLKGYSTRENDDFKIANDGIGSQKFIVEIKGDKSSVSPNNMSCTQAGRHTLLCFDQHSEGQSTIETWAVYPMTGKAVHTKSINGYGPFNGGNLFVGSIKGRCS